MSGLEIARVRGLVTVQDGGRPGHMHLGIPPGGPLVPSGMARANVAAGNAPPAACLEITGELVVRVTHQATVGLDDGTRRRLLADEEMVVGSRGANRIRYLAVHGAFTVPEVHGGRGTLLVARLGGHHGRPLHQGDVLPVGPPSEPRWSPPGASTASGPSDVLHVWPGPDATREVLAALEQGTFHLTSAVDRVGARLGGDRLPPLPPLTCSVPAVRGAVQLPPDGHPIILGPDHPTTGGYPIVAVVATQSLGDVYQRAIGSPLAFAVAKSLP